MTADWLQGPYVYALYESYGFDKHQIAILFIIGFFSSMVFGAIVGPIADRYGRKLMIVLFGFLYAGSCLTKLYNNFGILVLGRLLGGISTSLLFSVFEAWMISEHSARGFPSDLLSNTFYLSTLFNGLVAIGSGLWASESANRWGYVSPFMWSALLLILVSVIVYYTWNENYIDSSQRSSLLDGYKESFNFLKNDEKTILLGLIQTLFEASMYIFVFMWTPSLIESLQAIDPTSSNIISSLPFGLIFASFMVCVMIGSSIFNIITSKSKDIQSHKSILLSLLIVSSLCFLMPSLSNNPLVLYSSFIIFEVCCGLYYPCVGTLRGPFIPESYRATIMNYFRVPLNLLVVLILTNVSSISTQNIFLLCSFWLALGVLLQYRFIEKTKSISKLN
ncbi:hypothetical protein DLAC_08912 [Tieghemostelium lacteum]|uniref:Molybdate-anion transporter n=1 Tax=Tieghemostelium lacteum TaxID=361077 RepID=A0A151Z8L9_TIELA|nr:hypothetical protein DLAC_08912 [Tieghemostelium lacteum]|eukprot:KYQ90310.1 hypothetical protein DLAC_08912 [Tieghemostelium lacteum]